MRTLTASLAVVSLFALAGSALGQDELVQPAVQDGDITVGPFSEPIELNAFIDLVAETLGLNITKDAGLSGQIAFNTGMTIAKRDLLPLLDLRLEELGYTIVPDPLGFYTIRRADQVIVNPGQTTRFIATPGLRPSSLAPVIQQQFRIAEGAGTGSRISYEDELGVIILTDTPRRIDQLEQFITTFLAHRSALVTQTIPLRHISAPVALQRARERLGSGSGGGPQLPAAIRQNPDGSQVAGADGGAGLTNIAQRLTTDPSDNALIFRGLPEELEEIRAIVASVDRVNQLVSKKYFTGTATRVIADLARRQGFGEVIEAQQETGGGNNFFNINRFQEEVNNQFQQTATEQPGGSQMLVSRAEGYITYFATPEQQASFAELIAGFDTEDEVVIVSAYKLEHSGAEEVAEILQSLIDRSRPQDADSPFLPQNQQSQLQQDLTQFLNPETTGQTEEGAASILGDESFVIADTANNQILVRAPRSQQVAFERLIDQIDLRRAQVYLEAVVVAVTDTDSFRLAIEGAFQDLDGNGNGGGVQTNFGLSTPGAGGFTDPRNIATGLSGITAAVIRSDYVPIIITATKTDTDSRVVATPQLLVDDNAQATVLTSQEVPFQQTTQSDVTTLTSFEFATAETSLTVTPQISVGGTIRLEYEINLESFTGPAAGGAPPPRSTNQISGESVTVPNGGTVVIGGLGLSNDTETVIKVPLLGDIPVLGHLFRDNSSNSSSTVLYVFLTPRVLREPTIQDYRLITLGPYFEAGLEDYLPDLPAVMIRTTIDPPAPDGGFVLPSDRDPSLDQQTLRPRDGGA